MSTLSRAAIAVLGGGNRRLGADCAAIEDQLRQGRAAGGRFGGLGRIPHRRAGRRAGARSSYALTLRNSSQLRMRGITLLVQAQEVTPGGKGSVSGSEPGCAARETLPVPHRLAPPAAAAWPAAGPLAEVSLDGVLFEDLSFYGPDRLEFAPRR